MMPTLSSSSFICLGIDACVTALMKNTGERRVRQVLCARRSLLLHVAVHVMLMAA
jgi:hypothetical protein